MELVGFVSLYLSALYTRRRGNYLLIERKQTLKGRNSKILETKFNTTQNVQCRNSVKCVIFEVTNTEERVVTNMKIKRLRFCLKNTLADRASHIPKYSYVM